jgi:phage head maturation protease
MTLLTKRATAAVTPSDNGEFDMILSNGTRDRDGETIAPGSWAQPLPEVIPINTNHSTDVAAIVGSGRPWLDSEGNLRVQGTFASTPAGQHIRSLVNEGHLRSVSVEFLRRKDGNATVNELVGGAFVNVPANPEARVLASKGAPQWFSDLVSKAVAGEDTSAMVRAIHDASVHLGAQCAPAAPDDDASEDGTDGADDGVNKAAALRLRLKALRR